MKKIHLLYVLMIFSGNCFSCDCNQMSLLKKIKIHNYIAKVKVITSKKSVDFEDTFKPYSVQIITEKQYYGTKINSIHLESMSDASCGIYLPEGTEWVIFGYTNPKNGLTYTSLCSENFQLDKKIDSLKYYNYYKTYPKEKERLLTILNEIKIDDIKNIHFQDGYFMPKDMKVNEILKSLNNLKTKKTFGCYKLKLSINGEVIMVNALNSLGQNIDRILLKKLIGSKWNFFPDSEKDKEILIFIHYEKNDKTANKYKLYPI